VSFLGPQKVFRAIVEEKEVRKNHPKEGRVAELEVGRVHP